MIMPLCQPMFVASFVWSKSGSAGYMIMKNIIVFMASNACPSQAEMSAGLR
jgi:hypothetical protein